MEKDRRITFLLFIIYAMWFKEKTNAVYSRILLKATETTPELDQNGKPLLFPCFEVSKWETKSYYQVFEWKFVSIAEWSYHSESMNKDVELVKIKFDCDWEEVVISGAWTWVMRNIVNSLAWSKVKLWLISIGLYEKEYEGKMYANVWVKNNWERTERLYTPDQQKTMKKVIKDPDTDEVVKVKRDEMESNLKEQYSKINANLENVVAKEEQKKEVVTEIDDSLPF